MATSLSFSLLLLLLLSTITTSSSSSSSSSTTTTTTTTTTSSSSSPKVCVVGSGIGGASASHFLKQYTCTTTTTSPGAGATAAAEPCVDDIRVFERRGVAGGRTATVSVAGDEFEAGASIIHPRNLHAKRFAALLGLNPRPDDDDGDDSWLGIWDGSSFVFKTLAPPPPSSWSLYRKLHKLLNSLLLFRRYGLSLLRMDRFVKVFFFFFFLNFISPFCLQIE